MLYEVFFLLLIFQIKHFLADYPLQGKYMLGKFKGGYEWIAPLAVHCLNHAVMTFLIATFYSNETQLGAALALIDFCLHFVMDRIKASPNILGRFSIESPFFWWSLGFDQMVHHLTHYLIIYFLVV